MLFRDDLVGAVLHILRDLPHALLMLVEAPHLTEIPERNPGYIRAAPGRDLAVPVLSDDEGVHASVVNGEMLPEEILESCGIQHRAGAKDPVLRETAQLRRRIGQDVHRICDNEQDPAAVSLLDLRNDGLKDPDILLHEVQPRLPRLLTGTRRNHDDGRIHDIVVGTGINLHRLCKRKPMADVQCLSLCSVLIRVDQHHLREKAALHQGKGRARSHESAADNRNLPVIYFRHFCLPFPYSQTSRPCLFPLSGEGQSPAEQMPIP